MLGCDAASKWLWIRSAYFPALRDLIYILLQYSEGLSATQVEETVARNSRLRTTQGRIPSRTTLFHYRNILLHLGIISHDKRKYYVNLSNPNIERITQILAPYSGELSEQENSWFSEFIFKNDDCRHLFFDLFLPDRLLYDIDDFIHEGTPVCWKDIFDTQQGSESTRQVLLQNITTGHKMIISSEDKFQAVLYGLRLWAMNEIKIIDEFYFDETGQIMFPIKKEADMINKLDLTRQILIDTKNQNEEWVMFSIKKLVFQLCIGNHVSASYLLDTLTQIKQHYPEYVVFIPTSKGFATISAITRRGTWSSKIAEQQLKKYLLDDQGRYISHIRFHRKLWEVFDNDMGT